MVLQSCTDPLHIPPGASSERFPTSFDATYDVSNTEVEEDVVVIYEGFIAINEEASLHIKQEETLGPISFPAIKSEPDEVCYVCICLLLDTFHQCSDMSLVFVMPLFLAS